VISCSLTDERHFKAIERQATPEEDELRKVAGELKGDTVVLGDEVLGR
jgi:hypothetical protein